MVRLDRAGDGLADVVSEVDLWAPYGAELRTLLRWVVGGLTVFVIGTSLGPKGGFVAFMLFPCVVMLKFVSLYPPLRGRGRTSLLLVLAVLFLPGLVYDYGWSTDFSPDMQFVPVTWALLTLVGLLLVCAWIVYAVIRLRSS